MSAHQHVCISYSQEDIKETAEQNLNIYPTNPIEALKLHEIFRRKKVILALI